MATSAWVAHKEESFRRKRFDFLAGLLGTLPRPLRILDVGGTLSFWNTIDYASLGRIEVTLLNLFPQENLPPNFRSEVGDARDLQAYRSRGYDVVFSNSVIGHVGSFDNQKEMAQQLR